MPRITIEEKVDVGHGIYKICPTIYELPERFVYEGIIYIFDHAHQAYYSLCKNEFLCDINGFLNMFVFNNKIDEKEKA